MAGIRSRTHDSRPTAAAPAVLVALLIGCTSTSLSPVTPVAPDGSSVPDATAGPNGSNGPTAAPDVSQTPSESSLPTEPTLPPVLQEVIPDGALTRPPDPLNLTVTPDSEAAATLVIDSEGGDISAEGADGVAYELSIPAGALALPTEITMSPIASVGGIPEGAGAQHTYGVVFEPNGLVFAKPARLTIAPPAPIGTETAAVIAAQGSGAEAGFQVFERSGDGITTEIDHFSVIVSQSPFMIAGIPAHLRSKFFSQSQAEAQLTSEIAHALMIIRQKELVGIDTEGEVLDLARSALAAFKRLVISPRVGIADRSCADANHAMEAYLDYQRQRQLLGVGEDPEFDLVGAGFTVPAALVDLAVAVCFKEAYDRCTRSGDFPSLAMYYLTFFERAHLLAGQVDAEHISTAQDYLRRCGRWRVNIGTVEDDPDLGIAPYHHEATREFHVEWQPGTGSYGIIGSTITGTGPVEQTKITYEGACAPVTIWDIRSGQEAWAEIKKISFDHYEGPTLTGEPIPPVATGLSLEIGLGIGIHSYWCNKPNGADALNYRESFGAAYIVVAQEQGLPMDIKTLIDIDAGAGLTTVSKGWQFRSGPYKAVNVVEGRWTIASGPGGTAYWDARLEVNVEHEPK